MKLRIKPMEVFSAALAIFAPLAALLLIDRGLEMGDEGYYLNFLRYPEAYDMATFFAIYYQPLMWLANGDIALVRAMNLLVLYGSALVFAFVLLRSFLLNRLSPTQIFVTSLAIAGSVVLYLRMWLPTPNYNTLNLLGLIWFAIGVVAVISGNKGLRRTAGLVAIGLGIGLSGAAKPTTGIVLVLLVGFLLSRAKLRVLEVLSIGTVSVIVIAPIIFFFGGFSEFLNNLSRASRGISVFGGGQLDFLSWERFAVRPDLLGFLVILCLVALLMFSGLFYLQGKLMALYPVAFAGVAVTLFFTMNLFWKSSSSFLELAASVPALAFILLGWESRAKVAHFSSEEKIAIGILATLPLAYVIGTGTNYLKSAGAASLFWVAALALVFLLGRNYKRSSLDFTITLSAFVIFVLALSIHLPFRQDASIFRQEEAIGTGASLHNIKVSEARLSLIRNLEEGFDLLDPTADPSLVMDITGDMPTAVTLLGGFQPGLPWYMTGYSGSSDLLRYSLSTFEFEEHESVRIIHVGEIDSPENSEILLAIGLAGDVVSTTAVNRDTLTGFLEGPTDGKTRDLRISVIRPSERSE
jgi:hypothetical protein